MSYEEFSTDELIKEYLAIKERAKLLGDEIFRRFKVRHRKTYIVER